MAYVQRDGVRLYYEDQGTAIGFIGHGWSTNLRFEPGEWSFVKARRDKGLSQALKERDEMVAPFFRLSGETGSSQLSAH